MLQKKTPHIFGLGLRTPHYAEVLATSLDVDFFEIVTENYLYPGISLNYLKKIQECYPISLHGVSLSIGNTEPLNWEYLRKVKELAAQSSVISISDHLSWTYAKETYTHDLLPLPYTEEALKHVVERVKIVQDYLGRQLLLENVSSYLKFCHESISEWDFLNAVAQEAHCFILLDINNVYVNSFNHGFDAKQYIDSIDIHKVRQFHLGGHTHKGSHIIDTHDGPVISEVWDLYRYALSRFTQTATIIERDDKIPPLSELLQELAFAKQICQESLQTKTATASCV